jgi:hypothetical protein
VTEVICRSPANRRWPVLIVSLAAGLFMTACSGHSSSSTLHRSGGRLSAAESFCDAHVLLRPPTSKEHSRIRAPRITTPPSVLVGPPPRPDIVFARLTITDFGVVKATGLHPTFDNAPEWVVIYRHAKVIPIGGPNVVGADGRPHGVRTLARPETILSLIDPTSGSGLDVQTCPPGP